MSHKANYWLASLDPSRVKSGAFRVLFHLCDHHRDDRDPMVACFPSQETLRNKSGLSNGALNHALKEMEKGGLLVRRRSTVPGSSERRTYYILGCDMEDDTKLTPEPGVSPNSGPPELLKEQTPVLGQANSSFGASKLRSTGEEPHRTTVEPQDSPPVSPVDILCAVVRKDTAVDFASHRKAMRKPLTVEAANRLVKKLADHPDPDAVFDMSIENGWQGVFPEKVGGSHDNRSRSSQNPQSDPSLDAIAIAARSRRSPGSAGF